MRSNRTGALVQAYERALSTTLDDRHLWRQFCLALIADGKYNRALIALEQFIQLYSTDGLAYLLGAKVCLHLRIKVSSDA